MGMIRVALALAVLFTHLPIAPFRVMGGGLAVQSFFIISGFYMALVLEGKYADRALFYSNRLLRLAPTYFVMLVLSAIALFVFSLSATASPELFADAFGHPGSALLLGFENLAVFGQEMLFWFRLGSDGLVFDASGALPGETSSVAWQALLVPQSWSLSMELMFYLLAPWLVRLRTRTLFVIAAASIGLRFAGHALPVDYGIWQGRLFPTALFLFVLGMLAQRALPRAAQLPRAGGYAGALVLLALIALLPQLHLPDEPSRWLMYSCVAAVAPLAFSAFRHSAFDRWIGDLSYPIYLCHLLVVGFVL
ncbi:MAG TPA: acyltransferase family protein, partial [Nevskiaceae bacterium]|nr:acyltransferase family protein [Nevskiaceae bacterium]